MAREAAQSDPTQERPKKLFADQFDDEEVLFVFRKHPVVMRKGLIVFSLGPLAGVLPSLAITNSHPEIAMTVFFGGLLGGFILGLLLAFPSWIAWFYSIYIVTDQRLIQITQKGLFHRSVVDIGLNQIQMVNYEIAGFQETLMGFGTIMMQTYMGDLVIHDVHHPAKIQKKLLRILREEGIVINQFPGNREQVANEEKDS